MKKGKLSNGYAADDCAALYFINGKLHKVVSSQPNSKAYQVKLESKRILETELKTYYLGGLIE